MKTTMNRKRNKHGRTGARKPLPQPSIINITSKDYITGYERGHKDGYAAHVSDDREFLEMLLTKRNAKDMKGLIEKRLHG